MPEAAGILLTKILDRVLKILTILCLLVLLAGAASAADPEEDVVEVIRLDLSSRPDFPEAVMSSLHSVIFATLEDVLLKKQTHGIGSLKRHIDEVSTALREGLNVVLEPKGFTVNEVKLDIDYETDVSIGILPAGGTGGEPGPVCNDIEMVLLDGNTPDFWDLIFLEDLDSLRVEAETYYSRYLINLPLVVTDERFIIESIRPYTENPEFINSAFPDYSPGVSIEFGATSIVNIILETPENPVRRLRVRMSGDTVPNVVLDQLRDAITSRSDIVVGLPKALVMANLDAIGEHFASLVENDKSSGFFAAEAKVRFDYEDEDNSLIAICEVRSTIYDVNLRGYIDFGLEDADSSEVEGRVGYFFSPEIEIMVVLNLYTNDMTLEPDALLGWRPREGSFFAGGYDFEARNSKFFFSQKLGENIFAEGEIFAENDRSQFGLLYRFHQYFSGGLYGTGDGDYWFRTTFRL
jgi:hypothetical protein